MSEAKCIRQCQHPEVKVEDAGKKAIFLNPDRVDYRVYSIDGCLVDKGKAADFAVEEVGLGLVVVELKGRNVEHAFKQVDATTHLFRKDRAFKGKIASLVVSRETPIGSATINRHRARYAKAHGGAALSVCSSGKTKFVLKEVLTHRGR